MTTTTNVPRGYATISEAGRQFKVSGATIYSWVKHGHVSAVRIGPRRLFVLRADIQKMVTPQMVVPT